MSPANTERLKRTLWVICAITLSIVGCKRNRSETPQRNIKNGNDAAFAVIVSEIDAVATMLPDEAKNAILEFENERDFLLSDSPYYIARIWDPPPDSRVMKSFQAIGVGNGEDALHMMYRSVWLKLHGHDLRLLEQAQFYQNFRRENAPPKVSSCPVCSHTLVWQRAAPLAYAANPKTDLRTIEEPAFPDVLKMLHWFDCPNEHKFVWTSASGLQKPTSANDDARKMLEVSD